MKNSLCGLDAAQVQVVYARREGTVDLVRHRLDKGVRLRRGSKHRVLGPLAVLLLLHHLLLVDGLLFDDEGKLGGVGLEGLRFDGFRLFLDNDLVALLARRLRGVEQFLLFEGSHLLRLCLLGALSGGVDGWSHQSSLIVGGGT